MSEAEKAFGIGATANELSKQITGSTEASATRTTVAVTTGGTMGAVAAGAITVGAAAVGITTAPITVSLAVGSAVVAGFLSLFD